MKITTIRVSPETVKSAKRILKHTRRGGWNSWTEAGLEVDSVPIQPTIGKIVEMALSVIEKRLK